MNMQIMHEHKMGFLNNAGSCFFLIKKESENRCISIEYAYYLCLQD